MRQRTVKNKDEIIARCARWLVSDPKVCKGNWIANFSSPGKVFLEIGSGKGQFITSLAASCPEHRYIAIEGGGNIAVRILEKAEAEALDNLLVVMAYAEDLNEWFAEGEAAGIYLNFCDPWPKLRHAGRRLTHRSRLAQYRSITTRDGVLELKTDNQQLFEFSLTEFDAAGLVLLEHTRDLHGSDRKGTHHTTEYEDKFSGEGRSICYAKAALHHKD